MKFFGKNSLFDVEELLKTVTPLYTPIVPKNNYSENPFSKKEDKLLVGTKKRSLRKGDIVGVGRGSYDHYGIYTGRASNLVFHYTSGDSDISGDNNKISLTSFDVFLRGSSSYFIVHFDDSDLDLFSPDEIVKRAGSRYYEQEYCLLANNCEHFAFWCALDIHYSSQSDIFKRQILEILLRKKKILKKVKRR